MKLYKMLTVTRKKSTTLDLYKGVVNLFDENYPLLTGKNRVEVKYKSDSAKLHEDRKRALQPGCEHNIQLDILCRYHDDIATLETIFPRHLIDIPFKWKDSNENLDTFIGRRSLSVCSFTFERVCILYNIGALQTEMGVKEFEESDSDEKLKNALMKFQQAAGIFESVVAEISKIQPHAMTSDMTIETLTMYALLFTSQAQEIMVIKAIRLEMKYRAVAKVCETTSVILQKVLTLMKSSSLKAVVNMAWLKLVKSKSLTYAAMAQFFQSFVTAEKLRKGEEISRLKFAANLFERSNRIHTLPSFFANYWSQVLRMSEEAKRSNAQDYNFQLVPESADLEKIQVLTEDGVAKPIAPNLPMSTSGNKLFKDIPPLQQIVGLQTFIKEKINSANLQKERLENADNGFQSSLEIYGIPDNWHAEDKDISNLPLFLKQRSNFLVDNGGVKALQNDFHTLADIGLKNILLLDEIEKSGIGLRSKATFKKGNKFSFKETDNANKFDFNAHRFLLEQTLAKDTEIQETWDKQSDAMEIFASEKALEKYLPICEEDNAQKGGPEMTQAQNLLHGIQELKMQRFIITEKVRIFIKRMQSSNNMVALQAIDDIDKSPFVLNANSTLKEIIAEVDISLQKQQTLIEEIQPHQHKVRDEQLKTKSNRSNKISDLIQAFNTVMSLRGCADDQIRLHHSIFETLADINPNNQPI